MIDELSYDDLVLLAFTVQTSLNETLSKLQFLEDRLPESDLIDKYVKDYERLQRIFLHVKQVAINKSTSEIIKQN